MQKYQHKNELTALNKKFQTSSYLDNSSSKKLIKEQSWQKPRYKISFQKKRRPNNDNKENIKSPNVMRICSA